VNCPVIEQTGDGARVGRCWFHLEDGKTCPRHGDVSVEVEKFERTGLGTLENVMRKRKGLPLLGRQPCELPKRQQKGGNDAKP
jgi:hypothetical protein